MQKKKSVLITGIAGFLGQNLSRALLAKDYEVSGIDDLSIGCRAWLPNEVDFWQLDVSFGSWAYRFPEYDYIIHLASAKIPRMGNAELGLLKNTEATYQVIEYIRRTGAKLIYLSSSEVYGKQTEFSETSDFILGNPNISRWSYAISKMWSEQYLYASIIDGLDFNIVRLFGTYGPYHALSWTAGPQSVFISQALRKKPITLHGDGSQKRCFQYIDDAVDGILRIMESNYKYEIFNIGNPNEEISIKALGEQIWNMINPKEKYQHINILHSIDKYEEISSRIPEITKAQKLLRFKPKVSLKEGLAKTIEWQRKELKKSQLEKS